MLTVVKYGSFYAVLDGVLIVARTNEKQARLFAAAPELLEALKSVEWIKGAGTGDRRYCPHCKAWEHKGHTDDCIVRAAIAKAEDANACTNGG